MDAGASSSSLAPLKRKASHSRSPTRSASPAAVVSGPPSDAGSGSRAPSPSPAPAATAQASPAPLSPRLTAAPVPPKKKARGSFVPWNAAAAAALGIEAGLAPSPLHAVSVQDEAGDVTLKQEERESTADSGLGTQGEPSAAASPEVRASETNAGPSGSGAASPPPPADTPVAGKAKAARRKPTKEEAAASKAKRAAAAARAAAEAQALEEAEEERRQAEAEELEREEGIVEGDEDEDTKVWCICRTQYDDENMMIACDHCDEWYHTSCVGMAEADALLIDLYVCAACEAKVPERTTWKPKCLNATCEQAAMPPLSRYCSQACGILTAAARIARSKAGGKNGSRATAERLLGRIARAARRTDGVCVWTVDAKDAEQWSRRFRPQDNALPVFGDDSTDEEIASHRARLQKQQAALDTRLERLDVRLAFLRLAGERVAKLPPLELDEAVVSRAPKSKKKSSSVREETSKTAQRCGYDERMHWDDDAFARWAATSSAQSMLQGGTELDGQLVSPGDDAEDAGADAVDAPIVCGAAKRKCRKHGDWLTVRDADMQVERDILSNERKLLDAQLEAVELESASMRERHEAARLAQRAADAARDAALATALARDGGRRATAIPNGR